MKCKKCLSEDASNFYAHSPTECKTCIKTRVRLREEKLRLDPEWNKKEKQRHRDKYHRLGYKEKHKPTPEQKKIVMDRYKKKYPEKINAHLALLAKRIKSPAGIEYHHWSYQKEHHFDWIELTISEHARLHRYIVYDQERMMYRTLDGVLLDTKERHIEYFESIKNLE